MTTVLNWTAPVDLLNPAVSPSAACRGTDTPDLWHPATPTTDYTVAADVCATCDIRVACEAFGRAGKMHGVWGGVLLDAGRTVRPDGRIARYQPPAAAAS